MTCTLTKLVSANNNLRTNVIYGEYDIPPIVGRMFIMTAEPLDPTKSYRKVTTSPVTKIQVINDTEIVFNTQNSVYKLEVENTNDKPNN